MIISHSCDRARRVFGVRPLLPLSLPPPHWRGLFTILYAVHVVYTPCLINWHLWLRFVQPFFVLTSTIPRPTHILMPKSHANNRGWWRQHFHDHPKFAIKDPESTISGKVKVYCKVCFDKDISSLLVEDDRDVLRGQRVNVRSREQIEIDRKL